MELSHLTGTSWNRYGHRRVYVTDGERQIGWFDPATGEAHPETPPDLEPLNRFAADWLAGNVDAVRPGAEEAADATRAMPAAEDDTDLALAAAGSGTGARAAQLLAKKSWWERTTDHLLMRKTDSEAWRRGALGERLVGKRLAKLPEDWKVLHSVPIGSRGADIDHLIFGPGGIFTVNTKNHARIEVQVTPKGVRVGGHSTRYVRSALAEAERASAALGVAALPVICIIPSVDGHYTHKGDPAGVTVVTEKEIVPWLKSLDRTVSAIDVEAVYNRARRASTWKR